MSKNSLTKAERTRLDEIVFCFFIAELFRTTLNTVRVYDLIELLCDTAHCSFLRLQPVLSTIMVGDRSIAPTRKEQVVLYHKAGYPIRTVCSRVGISMRDYYIIARGDSNDVNTSPRFDAVQDEEITKFLDAIQLLLPERRYTL